MTRSTPSQPIARAALRLVGSCSASILLCACGTGDDTTVFTPIDGDVGGSDVGGSDVGGSDGTTPSSAEPSDPAAGGESTGECGPVVEPTYAFESRFAPGASSVSYSGQMARHVLISEMSQFIGGLTSGIDNGTTYAEGELVEALQLFVQNAGNVIDTEPLSLSLPGEPELSQSMHGDVSTEKNLIEKLAGNDASTDYVVWGEPGTLQGWREMSMGSALSAGLTPENLLTSFCEEIERNALARQNAELRGGPDGQTLPVYVTVMGQDLQQLIEKFLLGAVAFAQGADDYLSNDVEGKGLLASAEQDGDSPYSALEHAWDEGFGYFGAARDYDDYTDDEVAGEGGREAFAQGWHDSNGDCAIDLTSEVNFGAAVNAAKRDRGASVPTDFSGDAFSAFVAGRQLISEAAGPLSDAQMQELIGHRDQAVAAWENSLAATAVHYVNDTRADVQAALDASEDYSFVDQAKHWSELKGFALSLQFNPSSPLSAADFVELHERIGDAPVVPDGLPAQNTAALEAYRVDLEAARDILQAAYSFAPENTEDW